MADVISPVAVPTMNSVEPPPMSITSTGPSSRPDPAQRAGEGQLGLAVAADHVREHAEPLAGPRRRTRPGSSRPGRPRWRRSGSGRPARRPRRINSAYASTAAKVRRSASGWNSPVASTPWPSRTISVRRSPLDQAAPSGPGRRSAGGSSWCRSRRPRPAVISGRAPPGRAGSRTRRSRPDASSPSGLTPGPPASAWPTRACRHLTRSGMPPALTSAISGTPAQLRPVVQVAAVGLPVAVGELVVVLQPGRHVRHQPARLQASSRPPWPAGRSGSTSSGTVCRRPAGAGSRPRRAVPQGQR